jgi:hypothetical protein
VEHVFAFNIKVRLVGIASKVLQELEYNPNPRKRSIPLLERGVRESADAVIASLAMPHSFYSIN